MSAAKRRVTIYDIARAAKLAASTVSRALDPAHHERVSDATRARIASIAARLGYQPNRTARALSRGGTDTIAILLPANTRYMDHEYYSRVVMAAVQLLADSHMDLKVHALSPTETRGSLLHLRNALAVDGMIAVGLPTADRFTLSPAEDTPPTILLNSYRDDRLASVDADNAMGGRLAAELFIARGHTQLGMLTGPTDSQNALDRQRGYRDALRAAGLAVRPHWFVPCLYGFEEGFEAAQHLCARRRLPTAVFCANDAIASGALRAFHARGVRCPQDISIIGFDDFLPARYAAPPLTTIAQPVTAMVQAAVQQVLVMLRRATPAVRITVPVHMVERASVAPLQ